jgi:hypothetical protein
VTLSTTENRITKDYNLTYLQQVTCIGAGQANPAYVSARGHGVYINRDQNCNETRRDTDMGRGLPGYRLDTLAPQAWVESDKSNFVRSYSTDVVVNVPAVDFPGTYPISGTISHTEGQLAQLSASSKYFEHTFQRVSSASGRQEFNMISTLRPISAPNNITFNYDAKNMVLTLQDPDVAELSHIDPKNKEVYSIAVYVNWNRTMGHEKFGNVLVGSANANIANTDQQEWKLDISKEMQANAGYSKQLKKGGKDWALYVEVTTTRRNKYVRQDASSMGVYEIKVDKNFNISSNKLWTEGADKYR